MAVILYFTMAFANAVYQSYVYAGDDKIHPMTEKDIEAVHTDAIAKHHPIQDGGSEGMHVHVHEESGIAMAQVAHVVEGGGVGHPHAQHVDGEII